LPSQGHDVARVSRDATSFLISKLIAGVWRGALGAFIAAKLKRRKKEGYPELTVRAVTAVAGDRRQFPVPTVLGLSVEPRW
jgi:hypothetical protein